MRFSADGEQLAYIDGDTLSLVELAVSTIQIPQRIALAPEQTLVSAEPPANELLWDGDDLYVMHRAVLFRVSSAGEIVWQQELPENMHALQLIDTQHLALFSEQEVLLFSKEDGTRKVQLAVDKKQRIADQTFTDRYLSLLLEDRFASRCIWPHTGTHSAGTTVAAARSFAAVAEDRRGGKIHLATRSLPLC